MDKSKFAHLDKMRGWSGDDVWRIYEDAVNRAVDGDTLVEVGVAYGRSIAHLTRMAMLAKKVVRIVGVDLWQTIPDGDDDFCERAGGYYERCVLEMMEHAPEEYANVRLLRLASSTAAKRFETIRPSFVFIDADHSYEAVLDDIRAWGPILKNGGTLAGHDFDKPGVAKAVREQLFRFEEVGGCWRTQL